MLAFILASNVPPLVGCDGGLCAAHKCARAGHHVRSTSSPRSFSILADVWVEGRVFLGGAALGSRRRQSCRER